MSYSITLSVSTRWHGGLGKYVILDSWGIHRVLIFLFFFRFYAMFFTWRPSSLSLFIITLVMFTLFNVICLMLFPSWWSFTRFMHSRNLVVSSFVSNVRWTTMRSEFIETFLLLLLLLLTITWQMVFFFLIFHTKRDEIYFQKIMIYLSNERQQSITKKKEFQK